MKTSPTYLLHIILILTIALALSACATESEPTPTAFTVIDQAGRTVEISGPVNRLVSGYYISTSVCIALGISDSLVGIEARAASRPIYALSKPELLELPDVGTARDFNLEACAALEPDLVILPIRLRESAETLAQLGIQTILVDPENYDGLIGMIKLIGEATGSAEMADTLISHIERSLEELKNLTVSITEKPRVYMGGIGSYLQTVPDGMFQSTLIELAGGINAAGIEGNSRVEISYEQLLAINPDVIIIPPEADYDIEDISGDAALSTLDAVIGGRIYKMPGDFEAWDSPIPSFTLGIRWLLGALHPEIYQIENLENDIEAFYGEFYGYLKTN